MSWQSYANTKSVQIRWLPKLPSHWQEFRLKHIVNINTETLSEKTDPTYEIKYVDIRNVTINGLEREPETLRFEEAPSRARRIVHADDTIISTVRTYLQAIAYFESVPNNLISSTGFAVLSPRQMVYPKFLYFLVREPRFINDVTAHSVGISYPAINPTELANLPVWLPPLAEQRAIVAFLERETGRIDALIAKKRALIARLQEKRTALISHAVTKGLDPTAPLKPSGIPWLGDIPAHWSIRRLKFVATVSPSKATLKQYPINFEVSFLPMELIGDDGSLVLTQTQELGAVKQGYTYFEDNDVVVAKITPCFENGKGAHCTDLVNGIGFGSTELHVLRAFSEILPDFLYFVIFSQRFREIGTSMMTGAAGQKRVPEEFVSNYPVCLPPIEEQNNIVMALDNEIQLMDDLVNRIDDAIKRLEEYRTALISAAVTGKIKT